MKVRMLFAAAAALALMVGAGTAIAAAGGGDLKQEAARIADRSSFEASVAKNLGTTSAKLNAAVKAAATARIDAALAADEITAAEAETLKEALADGNFPAMRLATAAGVAKQLDTTEAKLNAAFSSAAKAQASARVDQALKDGKITESAATEMKAKIAAATFPGFGAGGPGHHGGPGGPDGHGGPGGPGMGFGPPPGAGPPADGSSSTPASLPLA
jgi:hypothetical protein